MSDSDARYEYLEDLRRRVREAGTGVEIKDRPKGKKTFLASDLVVWLAKNEKLTVVSSTILGQELEDNGFIRNVVDDKKFDNKPLLFRFQADEESKVLNNKQLWKGQARNAVLLSQQLLMKIILIYKQSLMGDFFDANKKKAFRDTNESYKQFALDTAELQKVSISTLTHPEQFCFWVNIYNTLVLHSLVERTKVPAASTNWYSFESDNRYNIAGMEFPLLTIEHGILRANLSAPNVLFAEMLLKRAKLNKKDERFVFVLQKTEPLVSFVLCHNTKSSPCVRILEPSTLRPQLFSAVADYLDETIVIKDNKISLPKFFYWYATDFGVKPDNWTENVQAFRTLASDTMKIKIDKLADQKMSVKFEDYNWMLVPVRIYPADWEQIMKRDVSVEPRRSTSGSSGGAGEAASGARSTSVARAAILMGLSVDDWITKFPTEVVPPFLTICMKHIEAVGIQKDGIFRFSGNPLEVSQLQAAAAEGTLTTELLAKLDIHSVCAFFKVFISELADPLLGFEASELVLDLRQPELSMFLEKDKYGLQISELAGRLKSVIQSRIKSSRVLFCRVILEFLARVGANSEHNDMDLRTIALLFGPALVRLPGQVNLMIINARSCILWARCLIELHKDVFS